MVFEEGHDRNNSGRGNVNSELVLPDRELLYVFRQTREKILAVGVEARSFFLILVRRINYGSMYLTRGCRRSVK